MIPDGERVAVLEIALTAVVVPLRTGRRWQPGEHDVRGALAVPGASFVTLRRDGALLGCIGSLEPRRALGVDVAHNAAAAAFDDPRLPPVTTDDLTWMHVHVSVLSALSELPVRSWAELTGAVRPAVDGLLVTAGAYRATFLPAVWETLAEPEAFLDALWQKAGLPPRAWPQGLRVQTYAAEEFGAEAGELTVREQ